MNIIINMPRNLKQANNKIRDKIRIFVFTHMIRINLMMCGGGFEGCCEPINDSYLKGFGLKLYWFLN